MKKLFLVVSMLILSGCNSMYGPKDIKCVAYYTKDHVNYKANVFDRKGDMFVVSPIMAYGSFRAPVSYFYANTCDGVKF